MHFDGFDVDAGLQAPIAEAMLVNPRSAAATAMVHLSPNALEASRGVFEVPGCCGQWLETRGCAALVAPLGVSKQ